MFDDNVSYILEDAFAVWIIGPRQPSVGSKLLRLGINHFKGDSIQSEIDLHINEWIMTNSHETKAFIDFGIRIYNVKGNSAIGFFIPFSVEDNEIEDLTMKLAQESIANGIFNTKCTVAVNWEVEILDLNYNQRSSNAAALPRRVVKTSFGTEVYFNLKSIMNYITKDEFYIRFRVPHKTLSELLSRKKKLTSTIVSLITSPIVKVDYTYFIRVNEVRTMPSDLQYKSEIQKLKIRKIMVSMSLNGVLKINSDACYKLRILEKELFKDYVPPNFQLRDCIAYQWLSEKISKTHYTFALIFREEKINFFSLMMYLAFVVLLSAVGSVIAPTVQTCLNAIISVVGGLLNFVVIFVVILAVGGLTATVLRKFL